MRAMLLAAGAGVRLRPLTLATPKALVEVGGKPLIQHHVERLAAVGIGEFVVNLHHLGEQIRDFLGDGQAWGVSIAYSEEQELLETGGGIARALPLLGSEPFVVVSADTYTDFDFARLLEPLAVDALGHLVLVDNPSHHPRGDFVLERLTGRVLLAGAGEATLTYSGVALMHPALFAELPAPRVPLRPLFERAIGEGRMTGERHNGLWSDVGTAERLAAARAAAGA